MRRPVFFDLYRVAGRRTRLSFALVLMSCVVCFMAVYALLPPVTDPPVFGYIFDIVSLALCWGTGIFAASQRFRDFGWSGWWGLLTLLPILGWVICLALFFIPGTRGPNRYGSDPLAIAPEPAA